MNAYRTLIDHIAQLLATGDAKIREAVESLAHQYGAAVAFANERFRRCEAYLREGNRSEAIRECEDEPNLLDLFAILNFPQKEVWEATIVSHGLPAPERLLEGVAQELNEAYDKEAEVNALLRTHRLLALARRPIVERLPILRLLAKAEPNVAHWDADTRTMEKVRLKEIDKEIRQAFKRRDAERLLILERELGDSHWLETPSVSLMNDAARCSRAVRSETTRNDLEEIGRALNTAYAAQDTSEGKRLRASWQAKRHIADLAPGDPLIAETADALAWLAEEDAKQKAESDYRQAVTTLSDALDGDASRAEVERLYAAATRFDREIPETLIRRANERLAYLDQAADRRTKLIVTLGVAAVVVAGAVTWFALSRHSFNRRVAGHVSNVEALIDEGKLDETKAYFDRLAAEEPAVFRRPELQRIHSEWNEANQTELERAEAVRELLAQAGNLLKQAKWPDLQTAEETAAKAAKQAKPGKETEAVAHIRREISAKKKAIQDGIDGLFDTDLGVWRQKVAGVDKSDEQGLLALQEEGKALVEKGKSSVPPVSAHLESSASDLIRKLGTWRQTELEKQYARDALSDLDETVGDAVRFSIALARYRSRFESEQNLEELKKQVAADMDVYSQVQEVNGFLNQLAAEPLSQIAPETARRLLEDYRTGLSPGIAGHPARSILDQYAEVLEPIAARKRGGIWITGEVNTVLGKPLILRLQSAIAREDGQIVQYYFHDQPRPPLRQTWTIDAFVDFDLTDTKSVRIEEQNLLNPRAAGDNESHSFDWTSPQRRFADVLIKRIARIKQGGDWEREFAGALQDLEAESHLEPLLKVQLLQLVGETAAKGSHFMKEALAPELALLSNLPDDLFEADWIWPHDEEGKDARERVQMILRQVRPVKTIMEGAARRRVEVEAALKGRLEWIGYLWPDSSTGNWVCRPPEIDSALSGDLYLLVPPVAVGTNTSGTNYNGADANSGSADTGSQGGGQSAAMGDTPMKYVQIGSLSGGKAVLSGAGSLECAAGRPVYCSTAGKQTRR